MKVFFLPKRPCAMDYNFFVTFRIAFRFHRIKSQYKKAIPYKFERNRSTLPYSTMPLVGYPLRPKVSGICTNHTEVDHVLISNFVACLDSKSAHNTGEP